MKRFLIFSLALFCVTIAKTQVKFGIFGGPHASSANYSVQDTKQSTDYKFGFHLGAGLKVPFDNNLSFAPAINYRLMGYKVSFNTPSFPPDLLANNNNTSFHEVDLDFLLQFDFTNKPSHFFLKAGPTFGFILAGKEHYDLLTGNHVDRNMKFSVLNSYGRYGAAITLQFGYETAGGFTVGADFMQHLISMNNEDEGPSIRNHLIGLTLGQFLHTKKK